jgi:hypothetical protein
VKYEDILCNIETDSSNLVHGFLLTLYEGVIYYLPLSLAIMRNLRAGGNHDSIREEKV